MASCTSGKANSHHRLIGTTIRTTQFPIARQHYSALLLNSSTLARNFNGSNEQGRWLAGLGILNAMEKIYTLSCYPEQRVSSDPLVPR